MDTDLLDKVEKQRLELEANLAQLRRALKHWQTLELDYEGLKDEFYGLDEDATKQACLEAAHEFKPYNVDEKELSDLIEPSKGKTRSPSQIIDVLSKRGDYVLRNIATLRDQITNMEKRRNALLLVKDTVTEEETEVPLAELTEELDADGNVISSKLVPQDETASKVLEVLDKTKVQVKDGTAEISSQKHEPETPIKDVAIGKSTSDTDAEDDVDDDNESIASEIVSEGASKAAPDYAINADDTEEEAQLRQEMLQYGLEEVGSIVAELELAEAGNGNQSEDDEQVGNYSDLDDDEYDDSLDDEAASEEEDGRSRSSNQSEKYRQRMEELQKQLGYKMENVGPKPDLPAEVREQIEHLPSSELKEYLDKLPPALRKQAETGRPPVPAREAAREAAIARYEALKSSPHESKDGLGTKSKAKKKVAFAPILDIADERAQSTRPATTSESIVERTKPIITTTTTPPSQATKVSRFKVARSTQPQTPILPPPMDFPRTSKDNPEGPKGKTIAETVVERPGPKTVDQTAPPDGDDFDEELQRRQIALEHHRLRNRVVHEQGGYVKGGEQDNWGDEYAAPEVEDEKTGEVRKISRFKAARMRNG